MALPNQFSKRSDVGNISRGAKRDQKIASNNVQVQDEIKIDNSVDSSKSLLHENLCLFTRRDEIYLYKALNLFTDPISLTCLVSAKRPNRVNEIETHKRTELSGCQNRSFFTSEEFVYASIVNGSR